MKLQREEASYGTSTDKTGTITEGKPKLVTWQLIDIDADRAKVAAIALGLAQSSDHPVSKAIAAGLTVEGESSQPVEGFTALVGRGVQGKIDGESYALGNHRLIEERLQCSDADGRQRGNRKSAGCAIGH